VFGVVLALVIVPFAAAIASLAAPPRLAAAITMVSGIACFGLVLALTPAVAHHTLGYVSYFRVDAVSGIFMLATGFLYAAVAVYAVGYVRKETEGEDPASRRRYTARFYALFNVFGWSMLVAPMMNSLALLWIAVEVTTVVSALLVAIENSEAAVEAAWKYVLIASAGLGLALLATIFAYFAGSQVLGQHYDLTLSTILQVGSRLPHTPVRFAFMLAVLGFGTKVGLFPVHTWLPDAHSEAPTPVSALLSGSLLAVSFYAILRYYQIAVATLGPRFPRDVLLVFGVASLLLAALYLLDQQDYKRLLAYSSVEHMGILAIGVSFGVPIALAGVLLHVLAHAAAKGNAFMGAGVLVRKFGSKEIRAVTGGLDLLPWSGPLFLAAILALSALPPFGIFRSEFEIVTGGLAAADNTATAILVVLVTVAFLGLSLTANRMLLTPRRQPAPAPGGTTGGGTTGGLTRGEPSVWMVIPVVAGLVALLVLGLHPPGELTGLLDRAVAVLRGHA
jgi:hydrogenase-4 component F